MDDDSIDVPLRNRRYGEPFVNPLTTAVRRLVDGVNFVRTHRQHLPLALGAISSIRCEVVQLDGRVKGTEDDLTLLYVGRRLNYDYLVRTIFESVSTREARRCNVFSSRRHAEELFESSDVLIADLGWPYNSRFGGDGESRELPDWMNMILDLGGQWPEVVARFRGTTRRNDLRIIRRNRYRYEITKDRQAAAEFYGDMYVPYMTLRHEVDAVIEPKQHVQDCASVGGLMQIYQDDRVVAAGVLYPFDTVLGFLWMGVPRSLVHSPPEAVISALYYFGIQYAHEQGYEAVDFMGTRAFLTDGAFKFKRKWGPALADTFSPGSIHIKPRNGSERAVSFCRRFPIAARTQTGFEYVLVADTSPVPETAFRDCWEAVGCAGVQRMTIMEIADRDETIAVPSGIEGCEFRLVRSRIDNFSKAYGS